VTRPITNALATVIAPYRALPITARVNTRHCSRMPIPRTRRPRTRTSVDPLDKRSPFAAQPFPPYDQIVRRANGIRILGVVSIADTERAALCDLLDELGPDAPTLCEGWTTRDMAVHLYVRDRDPKAWAGISVGRLHGLAEQAMAAQADRPYARSSRRCGPGRRSGRRWACPGPRTW
jgi:hypothetical protein